MLNEQQVAEFFSDYKLKYQGMLTKTTALLRCRQDNFLIIAYIEDDLGIIQDNPKAEYDFNTILETADYVKVSRSVTTDEGYKAWNKEFEKLKTGV